MKTAWLPLLLILGASFGCSAPEQARKELPPLLDSSIDQKGANRFAAEKFATVSDKWDPVELLLNATERYKNTVPLPTAKKYMATMSSKLGKVLAVGEWKLSEKDGLWSKAPVEFRGGKGEARIRVEKVGKEWKMDEFEISSNLLLGG